MEIECPNCGKDNMIETEDWPNDCSTDVSRKCVYCGDVFKFGMYCEIELR